MSITALQARQIDATNSSTESIRHDPPHLSPLHIAIGLARQCLRQKQHPDGHWCAELQGDTILESEYVLLMAFLGREKDESCRKAARYLLDQQTPEGGWNNFPGGPLCISTTVKGYFALKIAGHNPDTPYMRRARDVIRRHGGAMQCNSFTKFYLALLGQIPYECCPSVPPEMVLLPRWAYFNLYAMSSWTRTIVVPLSIFYAHKPIRRLPPEMSIAELLLDSPHRSTLRQLTTKRIFTWHNVFVVVDRLLKLLDPGSIARETQEADRSTLLPGILRRPIAWLRRLAVRRAFDWMAKRFEQSDGLGAIFPPMIYTVISLRCLGYADDSEEMIWALKQLEDLMIEEDDSIRLQPCLSPVWDTSLTLNALAMAGAAEDDGAVSDAVAWLLDREVRQSGDWSLLVPGVEPGGWVFEYRNAFYPDTDDTAMVLMGLARTKNAWMANGSGQTGLIPPVKRAIDWLLAMQNSDGGWAAFDRNINREVFTRIPFADHNAMLDPSCPDITARVCEALGQFGFTASDPAIAKAIRFIRATQDSRGCWIGRWGVNYLYGTWQVLQGLEAIGFDMRQPMCRRAVAWLKSVQQSCGGWGETCESYDDPSLAGQGRPTASQTAWALLGLIAAGEAKNLEARDGIEYLLGTQNSDGGWSEEEFTGTGFPKVFYLKYHYYSLYFPLMALARFRDATGAMAPTYSVNLPHLQAIEPAINYTTTTQ